jgi:hypothetical protein
VRIRAGIVATLIVLVSSAPAPGDGRPSTCAKVDATLGDAVSAGYAAFGKHSYRQAETSFRTAVALFSACPRQTRREDEARIRQVLAAVSWHLGEHDEAFVQLRALRSLNERFQLADGVASGSADAFAKRDYRRAYKLLIASVWDRIYGFINLPAGLADSGAADAIRDSLNAGAGGDYSGALAKADQALKADPDSQATRVVAGVANLPALHPQRARDLLFDALTGYDANPRGNQLTNFSLTAAYVLVALENDRGARRR